MKKITVSILTAMLMLSMVFSSSVFAAEKENSAWDSFVGLFSAKAATNDVGVEYRGHVQNIGNYPTDGSWIQGPDQLGTVGKSLRLEAFWIKLTDAPAGLHIKYEVHVQNRGWMAPVEDGNMAGTEGESLRIEAIKISLVDDEGNVSGDYTVTYKGHIQNVGDTAWIASGQQLGTTGSGLRLEALEVKIEKIAPDLADYTAALGAVTEANYTKASWTAYQAVVAANVMTEDNVQSEVDAATKAILDAQADLVTKAVVTSATAATQNTITLQGAALNKLAVADITVKNITVSSVVASADGKSATVTLASDLLADTDTPVAIKSDGDTSNFTVKFTIQTQKLAVVGGLFDKTLLNQKLTLTLDGVPVTTDYLTANGYVVTFYSYTPANVATTGLLSGGATNNTGLILVPGTDASYLVQATAVKGSTILSSEKVTVQVLDLVNAGSSIVSYKMTQSANAKTMNSTTLVPSEATTIKNVVVQYSSTNTVDLGTTGYVLETSDKNVISVSGNVITAVAPGTATITIRVGTLTKAVPFTVTQAVRVPTSVTPSTQVNAFINATTPFISTSNTITVVDQFGDPVIGMATTPDLVTTTPASYSQIKYALTGSVSGLTVGTITAASAATDAAAGKYVLPLTSTSSSVTDGQISTVAFTNKAGTSVGSFTVKAIANNAATTFKVEYLAGSVNQSDTLNNNMDGLGTISYVVNEYNSNGIKVKQVANIEDYTILYDPAMFTIAGFEADGTPVAYTDTTGTFVCGADTNYITLTPVANAKGTTPLKVYTNNTLATQVGTTRTITVNAVAPKITAVTFKTVTAKVGDITYKDALTTTGRSGMDSIISAGITLSETTGYDICINDVTSAPDALDNKTIYLDKNRNGKLDTGEKIGELVFTINNTSGITYAAGTNTVSIAAAAQGSFTYTVWDTTPEPTTPKVVVNSGTVVVALV